MSDFNELLKLYVELLYLAFYPTFTVVLMIYLNIGVFGWIILGLCLTPPTIIWYVIARRRMLNSMKMFLDLKVRVWDIDKTISEYVAMLKRKKAK